jgi:uncharacterized Zn finger protein (UPF0148 family)
MPKCPNQHDNAPGLVFCSTCGKKIDWQEPPEPEDIEDLQGKILALQEDLRRRDAEIKQLEEELRTVTVERNELVGKHPEVEKIVQQLDEKDRALQSALQGLEDLRNQLPVVSPASGARLLIESHPIANPELGVTFDNSRSTLDLSKTEFRIRASLERISDGSIGLLVHPGATINIKAPLEKRWRRLEGGARLTIEAGMILFDPAGAVNARLAS